MAEPDSTANGPLTAPISRRGFLGAVAGGIALAGVAGAGTASADTTATETLTKDKLGIQLWTCLGEYLADMPHTLQLVAQIGYSYVEFAFGYGSSAQSPTAKDFRKALDDAGLWCDGGHGTSPYPYDDKAWKTYVEDNLTIGTRYLGANINLPSTTEECLKYVDAVHKGYDVARSMGYKGSLFNHLETASWVPLKEDPSKYSVEFIFEHTSMDVWNAELDTAHALAPLGTLDKVLAQIRKHPGRFPLLHMKDGFAPPAGVVQPPVNPTPFGAGDFGRPDPADPTNRPHDGFQQVLTAIRETTAWNRVLAIAEQDGTQASCVDYAIPAFQGLNGLKFPYRVSSNSAAAPRQQPPPRQAPGGRGSGSAGTRSGLAATGPDTLIGTLGLAALGGAVALRRRAERALD
jgi:sugar phosphate isomerase/epimerase